MKRLIGSVLLLALFSAYLISCEKDDICASDTPTTASMILRFYLFENTASPQRVTDLQYFVEGRQDTISVGTVDSTMVPLRVDAANTKWGFVYNYRNNAGVLQKRISYLDFKYTTRQEYVSRACGYKTLFTLDPDVPHGTNPVLSNIEGDTPWIRDVEIVNEDIENQEEAHVKVYF